jgi:hypothetical protein
MGAVGDALRLGPISRTAVAQLSSGVEADEGPLVARLGFVPRGVSDLRHRAACGDAGFVARAALPMRPVLRLVLALLWLVSG